MIREIVTLLMADSPLTDMLATTDFDPPDPAIFTQWAPHHARPNLNIQFGEGAASDVMRAGDLDIDIWGDGASVEMIEPIRDRLVEILDHRVMDTDRGPVRFFIATDGPEQDEDPNIVRWRVTFSYRRTRTAWPNQAD